MSEPLVWLDLCSGLGGASQPALDRGWRVIRVDIDPRFKPDIVADVRSLPLNVSMCAKCHHPIAFHWFGVRENQSVIATKSYLRCSQCKCRQFRRALPEIDFLWASPPCNEFSKHGMMKTFFPNAPQPDTSILWALHRELNNLKPLWWAVENVSGCREFVPRWWGDPIRFGSHLIWGRLPCLLPSPSRTQKGGDYKDWRSRVRRVREACGLPEKWNGSGFPDIHQAAAKIPYEIGEAICRAVEARQ